ncbi:Lactoylglutathione lyase [Halomonadaceae bacterium LMG 33818]|uniref:lactoylglutathione lyase n=1 Tax=Cernens ardua TaxID=3402176 RepID=UPI003EDC9D8E
MSLSDIRQQHSELKQPTSETHGFVFNHTMLRVKDIEKSLAFYNKVLGFSLVDQRDFPENEFSLYFLAYVNESAQVPEEDEERRLWLAGQPGVLELTHNYGTEKEAGQVYHNGNDDPQGFGHICVSVPDIEAACARFEELGVDFKKRLTDGRMKNIAFIRDPDGYWIEIIANH